MLVNLLFKLLASIKPELGHNESEALLFLADQARKHNGRFNTKKIKRSWGTEIFHRWNASGFVTIKQSESPELMPTVELSPNAWFYVLIEQKLRAKPVKMRSDKNIPI